MYFFTFLTTGFGGPDLSWRYFDARRLQSRVESSAAVGVRRRCFGIGRRLLQRPWRRRRDVGGSADDDDDDGDDDGDEIPSSTVHRRPHAFPGQTHACRFERGFSLHEDMIDEGMEPYEWKASALSVRATFLSKYFSV